MSGRSRLRPCAWPKRRGRCGGVGMALSPTTWRYWRGSAGSTKAVSIMPVSAPTAPWPLPRSSGWLPSVPPASGSRQIMRVGLPRPRPCWPNAPVHNICPTSPALARFMSRSSMRRASAATGNWPTPATPICCVYSDVRGFQQVDLAAIKCGCLTPGRRDPIDAPGLGWQRP